MWRQSCVIVGRVGAASYSIIGAKRALNLVHLRYRVIGLMNSFR